MDVQLNGVNSLFVNASIKTKNVRIVQEVGFMRHFTQESLSQ